MHRLAFALSANPGIFGVPIDVPWIIVYWGSFRGTPNLGILPFRKLEVASDLGQEQQRQSVRPEACVLLDALKRLG